MEETKIPKRERETDLLPQWGNTKRLRCVKNNNIVKDKSERKRITSRFLTNSISPQRHTNNIRDSPLNNRLSSKRSPEKEDRYYTTRGPMCFDDNGKVLMDCEREDKGAVWPKLFLSLSNKEKEDDFMAMKGCKPPQRPKKRAKLIIKSLLLVSPGAWLSELCQERYEVREKKTSKKMQRARGLKGLGGSMESDSE